MFLARLKLYGLGLLFALLLSALAIYFAKFPIMQSIGFSALTIAIIEGMLIGNSCYAQLHRFCNAGIFFAKYRLLRIGIIMFGFHLTLHDIQSVGGAGILIDTLTLCSTFALAYYLGIYYFKLDKKCVMLIGAGSSICGAAAILATEPVVKGEANQVSVAVATVVTFGTISMFLYPLLYAPLHTIFGMNEANFGLFVGSTIHEVAQVVVAGRGVSDAVANTAVITKMIRVMMLAPFLLMLSMLISRNSKDTSSANKIVIPWFAIGFLAVVVIHSLNLLPNSLVTKLVWLDNLLLAMAMFALGISTKFSEVCKAGVKPLLLALCLFVYLICGGGLINLLIDRLFA